MLLELVGVVLGGRQGETRRDDTLDTVDVSAIKLDGPSLEAELT